jgi:MoxR-like ATPase
MLITGDHGSGKTKMVEQVHARLNKNLVRINISIDTDENDLIGGQTLVDGNVKFIDGPILTCMRTGSSLLLDEVDRGTSKLLAILSILEGSSFLVKKTGELIHPKEGFTVVATANTKGFGEDPKYLAQILDTAFLERFGITVEQQYPTAAIETKILEKVLDDDVFIKDLIKWANIIRLTYQQGGIDDQISTRRLLHIAKAYNIFNDKKKAVELCVARFEEDTKLAFLDLYSKVISGEDLDDEFLETEDEMPF